MYHEIKRLAKARNIPIRELEKRIGVGNNTINRWDMMMPSVDKVKRVADVLGVSVDELLKE